MISAPETNISLDKTQKNNDNDVDSNIETNFNNTINPNELAINNILYSINLAIDRLTNECEEYRRYSF